MGSRSGRAFAAVANEDLDGDAVGEEDPITDDDDDSDEDEDDSEGERRRGKAKAKRRATQKKAVTMTPNPAKAKRGQAKSTPAAASSSAAGPSRSVEGTARTSSTPTASASTARAPPASQARPKPRPAYTGATTVQSAASTGVTASAQGNIGGGKGKQPLRPSAAPLASQPGTPTLSTPAPAAGAATPVVRTPAAAPLPAGASHQQVRQAGGGAPSRPTAVSRHLAAPPAPLRSEFVDDEAMEGYPSSDPSTEVEMTPSPRRVAQLSDDSSDVEETPPPPVRARLRGTVRRMPPSRPLPAWGDFIDDEAQDAGHRAQPMPESITSRGNVLDLSSDSSPVEVTPPPTRPPRRSAGNRVTPYATVPTRSRAEPEVRILHADATLDDDSSDVEVTPARPPLARMGHAPPRRVGDSSEDEDFRDTRMPPSSPIPRSVLSRRTDIVASRAVTARFDHAELRSPPRPPRSTAAPRLSDVHSTFGGLNVASTESEGGPEVIDTDHPMDWDPFRDEQSSPLPAPTLTQTPGAGSSRSGEMMGGTQTSDAADARRRSQGEFSMKAPLGPTPVLMYGLDSPPKKKRRSEARPSATSVLDQLETKPAKSAKDARKVIRRR